MKTVLLIIFMLFMSYTFRAQAVFCAPGAEWRYLFIRFAGPNPVYTMKYTGDSIEGADTLKIIRYAAFFKRGVGDCSFNVLIRQRGDTVFMRNCHTLDSWQVLYNFSATPGQHWITTVKDSNSYGSYPLITHTVVVNAVSTVTINGMSLKKLFVSYCYNSPSTGAQCESAEIVERIGCTSYLFNYYAPPPAVTDFDILWKPLCYKDNVLGIVNFEQNGCNYYTGISKNELSGNPIQIYPNPASEQLSIYLSSASSDEFQVVLTDLSGREVKRAILQSAKNEVELQNLENGLYLLQMEDARGKTIYQQKLLKQD